MASTKLGRRSGEPGEAPRVERSMTERISAKAKGTFWPDTIFQTTALVAVVFAILLAMSYFMPAPLGTPADPLNQENYIPRPAWYFYFLFVILEIFKGPILVIIGALVLPGVLVALMVGLPFYDRNPSRKPKDRPVSMVTGFGLMGLVVAFTLYGVMTQQASESAGTASSGGPVGPVEHPTFVTNIKPIFQQGTCYNCHGSTALGGLNLETLQNTLSTGNHKPVVKPGDPENSLLWQVLVSPDNPIHQQMPLGGKPLSKDSITTISSWIKDGAK